MFVLGFTRNIFGKVLNLKTINLNERLIEKCNKLKPKNYIILTKN